MKTLSNNFNGKVLKTSNGFSVTKSFKKIEKLCKELDFLFEFEKAKTGTVYVTIASIDFLIWVRISNHTKRNEDLSYVGYINDKILNWLNGGDDPIDTYQAIDQGTFDLLFEKLKHIK